MRLVPPKPRELAVEPSVDAEAAAWARHLHHKRRALGVAVVGNALLLGLLLGVPFVRGQTRAHGTFARQARFTSCLLGRKVREPVGLGATRDEAERFATRLLSEGPGFAQRCKTELDAVPAPDAFFVLPSVKGAEERVREAVRVMKKELAAVARHRPGEPLSDRPLRALAQLRDTVRAQAEAANVLDVPIHASVEEGAALPRPALAPLYAARDAALSLWGDDQALYAVAVDKTGLSYLEVIAGKPLKRARVVRPAALRGLQHGAGPGFLLWATPEARCKERVQGCYGKTSSLAPAPLPLFSLPPARLIAAHVAGRPDRAIAVTGETVALAVANDRHGVSLATLPLPAQTPFDPALPPLPVVQREESHRDVLLVAGTTQSFALGTSLGTLALLEPGGARVLARFAGEQAPWVVACARGDGFDFAAGTASELRVGRVLGATTTLWEPVSTPLAEVVHASDPGSDRVQLSCAAEQALALVRNASNDLEALVCREGASACRHAPLARGVHAMAMLASREQALVAHAGDGEHPQIFVSRLGLGGVRAGTAVAPAACWTDSRGLCGPPHLARLGNRILLAGHQGSDLAVLESADEGSTWTAAPVY
jgi:hypothetical protein